MSMNLNCNLIELWQTPTHITYMCMIGDNGIIEGQFKGKKALAALKRYQQWYEKCLQDSFNDAMQRNPTATKEYIDEEIQDMGDRENKLDDQIKDIEKNGLSKLEVWIS